jgi:hypothetical protein
MITLPSTCTDCPLARPLHGNRFSCGNALSKVVRGYFPATAECHDSVINHPEWHFQPQILPDLQGLDPEWICNRIHLSLNYLDVFEQRIRDGEVAIKVTHQAMTANLKKFGDSYYSDRLKLTSDNPYWLALHLIHPDYLYLVVEEIIAERAAVHDYT